MSSVLECKGNNKLESKACKRINTIPVPIDYNQGLTNVANKISNCSRTTFLQAEKPLTFYAAVAKNTLEQTSDDIVMEEL